MATSSEGIQFFSDPGRLVMYPVIANVPAPSSWKTILWHKYASFAAFQSDIDNHAVPQGTKVVGYDDEGWSYTPRTEQLDPIAYTIKFAALAHAHGYAMLSTPAEDILKTNAGQTKFATFLKYGMARAVAPYVDYYSIQSQDLEQTVAPYGAYTQAIAAQLRGANPKVIITGGLSTNTPNGPAPTGADLDAAIVGSTGSVEGYWLNIVGATSPIADTALKDLIQPVM